MKRKATAAQKRHLERVAALGCAVCKWCMGIDGTPAQVHHVRLHHGWGRSGHEATIPLCPEHHTGNTGVHSMGREEFKDMYGKSEIELLAIVHQELE